MLRTVFVDDAADLLGVSRRTVYYRIREGKLRTVRTAGGSQRVLIDSIEALLRVGPSACGPRGGGAPREVNDE
jgi:excisionase family DNA binding protein